MNHWIRRLVLLAALVALPLAASANQVTLPYTFVPNTTIYSAQVNSNFNAIVSTINGNIDNTNIGTVGIYASQIIPSNSTNATFGGNIGYTFSPNAANIVPLTIAGTTAQTADLFDIYSIMGGSKVFWVDSTGLTHTAIGLSSPGTLQLTGSNASIGTTINNSLAGTVVAFYSVGSLVSFVQGNGTYTAGSSTFGSTSASVNGPLTASALTTTGYNPALSFPNGLGGSNSTWFGQNAGVSMAGIVCSSFYVTAAGVADIMCGDGSGNIGAVGGFYSASRRALKNNIQAYGSADDDIDRTKIERFCYKTEDCKPGETRHIGFIADDTPVDFAGSHHDHMDVEAVAAADLAAIQQLRTEVKELKREVASLRAR